ncbi:15399_t:CDS:2, partial [Racocetra persica]
MSNSRVDSGAFCEICIKCKERLPGNQWCQQCESTSFKGAFKSWTSGNHELDKFIRKTQLKAIDRADYLEWIPYERIEDIKFIAYGAYGSVSSGTWLDGPRWNWNDVSKCWERTGPKEVALKTINNSHNLKPFLNCSIEGNRIVHCYGISRDPQTKNYIAVIEYANNGSLINYVSKNFKTLTWDKKLSILSDIIQGLKNIHEENVLHKDLHADFIKGSGGARKQIEEAEKIRLELQSEQFIITSPPDTHKAYYTTREIKVIHVSPTKLNLEIYNFKPKLSRKLKLSVKKPEQTLAMSKERIHYQMDFDNKQKFDPLSDLSQAAPIVSLPDTFNSTSLNLELTDYTKKSKQIKKEIALEKSASKYYRSDCR